MAQPDPASRTPEDDPQNTGDSAVSQVEGADHEVSDEPADAEVLQERVEASPVASEEPPAEEAVVDDGIGPSQQPEVADIADSAQDQESTEEQEPAGAAPTLEVVPEPAPEPVSPPSVEALTAEVAELTSELSAVHATRGKMATDLAAAQARLRAVSKAFRDLQGEMDAFRKRQELQAQFKAERQSFQVIRAFLDPVQNLARSIDTPGDDVTALVQGLGMVQHQFMEALKGLGLEEVPGIGATFDPKLHEALGLTPVFDAEQDGKILHVHSKGFMVNGKVVQAAQVIVGKLQDAAGEA